MAKILRVSDNLYKLKVADQGNIVFDTGAGVGLVRITGDLLVEGTTTTVESTTTTITDPIITLNNGETGQGITLVQSGLEIDRGTLPFARILFDEDTSHFSPITANDVAGTFTFTLDNGSLVGIKTSTIVGGGSDIVFDFLNSNGVLTVANASAYSDNVYANEHIPSVKWVKDYLLSGDAALTRIYRDNTSVSTYDHDATPERNSAVEIVVDGSLRVTVTDTDLLLPDLTITNNTITSTNVSSNLVLDAQTGKVQINSSLVLEHTTPPTATSGFTTVYAAPANAGTTGVYFSNSTETGELVSKNRALLYSMIF